MFEYDTQIARTARNYNINERDVALCYLLAAGITRADAYYLLYARGNVGNKATHATMDTQAAEHLQNLPGTKVLIHKLKTQKPANTNNAQELARQAAKDQEEEKEESKEAKELQTRQGLTKKLRKEIAEIHGKDSVQGLIQLAKLEGYDKEDTREEEEKRKFFLPWRAKCRACRLMRAYREIEEQKEGEKAE